MKIKQTNQFKKVIKKLPRQAKLIVDSEIRKLCRAPLIGEQKKGDLAYLRVHKFKITKKEYLLGYVYEEDILTLTLLKLGPHENFYRDLKN